MVDKAHKSGQMFDWETTTYGKIYDDIDLFKDFKIDFLAIVYNDALESDPKVSSEPTEMDELNITKEEYIQLMADKAHKHGQMFDWETAKYGKIYDNIELFNDFEADFPAIVYNDALASDLEVSSELTSISANDKAGFGHNGAKESKVSKTITNVSKVETSNYETSNDKVEMPKIKTVRMSKPIIEEWESDSEDEIVRNLSFKKLND
nr:hypothetical protein [Tanacetum cinerariifolium]GEX66974.1 hypothetical protein [Tanacetum cinerariifolium]